MNPDTIVTLLKMRLPGLMAIYAFGSRIEDTANADSDLDLAVLVPGRAAPEVLWKISSDLADLVKCPVDLLDFRAASTVMQDRILKTGLRWYATDSRVDAYEAAVLNEKIELDTARAALINDIQREGRTDGK